jgi:hypothetical protein
VVAAAPRLDPRLLAAIERLDDPRASIAETNRKVGALAELIGLVRPSYEEVRRSVHALRQGRRLPSVGGVLVDITFRAKPPTALLDHLTDTGSNIK